MKLLTTSGLALLLTTAPVLAQTNIQEVTAQLWAEGYTEISVELVDDTIEVDSYRPGEEREMVFNAATWELVSDETFDDDEDDEDDEDDCP